MSLNTPNTLSLAEILGRYNQPNVRASNEFDSLWGIEGAPVPQQQGGLFSRLGNLGEGGGNGLLGLGQLGLGAIGSIGGLMNSRNMLGLARDQFKHTRDVTNTNLTNQIQSYNTALSDRARTRAAMEGRDEASANRYVEENKLRR